MPSLPSDDKRWKIVNGTMRRHGYARNALIETLHTAQSSFGYLDETAIRFIALSLHVPLSQAYGVVTFYHHFTMKPGQTTSDGNISLMTARCVGACGRAPVMVGDGELRGLVEPAQLLQHLESWAAND